MSRWLKLRSVVDKNAGSGGDHDAKWVLKSKVVGLTQIYDQNYDPAHHVCVYLDFGIMFRVKDKFEDVVRQIEEWHSRPKGAC